MSLSLQSMLVLNAHWQTAEAHDMLLLPALKRVQHFKRIACMFMLLDLAGRAHFYWLHYQVQTIRTGKMLAIAPYVSTCVVQASGMHLVSLFPPCRNAIRKQTHKKAKSFVCRNLGGRSPSIIEPETEKAAY